MIRVVLNALLWTVIYGAVEAWRHRRGRPSEPCDCNKCRDTNPPPTP